MAFSKLNILFLVTLLISNAITWHETGHMMIAKIAEIILKKEDPKSLEKANTLLKLFSVWAGEKNQPFIEAATWPDKIKSDNNDMMSNWHWISNLVSVDGTPLSEQVQIQNSNPYNVTKQILDDIDSLQFPDEANKDGPFYGQQDRRYMKSFALRNLIHFVGDVHQPLHGVEGISETHKDGDMGGNKVKTSMEGKQGDNLHFFWDHVFYYFSPDGNDKHGELTSPLNETNQSLPEKYAKDLMDSYPRSKYDEKKYKTINPMFWSYENVMIAEKSVYPGVVENQPLNKEYIDQAIEICKERIALGGYRLAEVIKVAFKEKNGRQITLLDE